MTGPGQEGAALVYSRAPSCFVLFFCLNMGGDGKPGIFRRRDIPARITGIPADNA